MCRLAGFWDMRPTTSSFDKISTLRAMRDALQYGGPDNGGEFFDAQTNLALGHRRLSIIDLSEAGNQPMYYKHFVLIFNGEIYNYQDIRQELLELGCTFQTQGDTEVILVGIEHWGMDNFLQRCRGMFAFVIWDSQKQELTLVRDRMGVKPLYFYWDNGLLLFASELKAFHQHPHFDKTLNFQAVSLYLQLGYIPQPHSIFEKVQRLEAGTYLVVNNVQKFLIHSYWNSEKCYQNAQEIPKNEAELLDYTELALIDSFKLRMVADVPVGAFLSGGIDSSLVVSLLQKHTNSAIQTFTIGFEHPEYNEANFAKKIAQHLGTNHTELYCTEQDFMSVLPKLADLYDEPFGDSSAIPTYLVSKLAKSAVKVSLSADGGDELFGGYTKYEIAQNFFPKIKRFPKLFRRMGAAILRTIDPLWLEKHSSKIPILKRYKNISHKLPKLLDALGTDDLVQFFQRSSSYIAPDALQKLMPNVQATRYTPEFAPDADRIIGFLGQIDMQTYLEGDIMTKVDRATMAVALEGREPFLDQKLVELSLAIPDNFKIRGKTTKYLLRQILYKYVPQELIDRPKQGFSIPVQQWLLTILRPELEELANDAHFIQTFRFDGQVLKTLITNFLQQKKYTNPHFIWFIWSLWNWKKRWL